jgi:hypothetical protein
MSSRNQTLSQTKSPAAGASAEKSSGGGAACVEILGFPQILYVRSFGDPDTLFAPLLDAARESFAMIERLSGQGENRPNAVMLSGMQLASSLLRDPSFSLGARGLSAENSYTVNLDAGTFHMTTQLYSVMSRRTSFFKVEIAGNISGGPFVVRNPAQGTVILQVDEERLRQANFFASSLAKECARAQMDQERFGTIDQTLGPEADGDVRIVVRIAENSFPVLLRKNEGGSGWNIIDARRQETVGTLSADMQEYLSTVTAYLHELFAKQA